MAEASESERLKSAYLTDVEGNKLYAWSHISKVRYNATKTLQDVLEGIMTTVTNTNNTLKDVREGKAPLNETDLRAFISRNYLMETLYDEDGETPIGFIINGGGE